MSNTTRLIKLKPNMTEWMTLCLLAVILLACVSYVIYQNQRVLPAQENAQTTQKLQCVSYAPYYGPNQSPVVPGIHVSRSQIEHDLKHLSSMTDCVRTYAVAQGLDAVPAVAKSLGMKVMLGAWVGWTDADNRKEVALAVKQANAYPDTVKAVIVGNEVLLRREQPETMVRDYLQWAQAHTEVPVTYADVWEYWLKHPNVEQDVDFVTVHILPYWEDAPVPIEEGAKHTQAVMHQLSQHFKKPLFIGETGWPSAGRQRFGAEPSLMNEARYLREFLQLAQTQGWQYNVIEAIDQPWKRDLEGTVGGYWGVFDTDLNPKFSLQGAVPARQDGSLPWLIGLAVSTLLALWVRFKLSGDFIQTIKAALIGGSLGVVGYFQAEYLWQACRNPQEWIALGSVTLLGWALLLTLALTQSNANSTASPSQNSFKLRFMSLGMLATMLYASYWLFVDGRYRNFPIQLYVLPVLTLFAIYFVRFSLVAKCKFAFDGLSKLGGIAGVLAITLSALVWRLEPQNGYAMVWFVLVLLTTLVVLWQSESSHHA